MRVRRAGIVLAWLVLLGLPGAATAQTAFDARGGAFRIEEEVGGPRAVVVGWLYNDGPDVVGLFKLRLEVLDGAQQVVARQVGWAYGNAQPGGRVYFRIAVPPTAGEGPRRIVLESFVRQAIVQSP